MDENKTYGTRLARLWKLFLSTLYISSFTFGGGFVLRLYSEQNVKSKPGHAAQAHGQDGIPLELP